MSFWTSELGEVTGRPEDAFAKSFTLIPNGTMALAKIESFVNDDQGFRYLTVNWVLIEGDYKGCKVSQKLKVIDADPRDSDPVKTKHRGLNMLKLMYNLFNISPKHSNIPTDQDLAVFAGKIAGIQIRETKPNEEGKQYNWVSEVHKAQGFKSESGVKLVVTHTNNFESDGLDSAFSRNQKRTQEENMTDDIPF